MLHDTLRAQGVTECTATEEEKKISDIGLWGVQMILYYQIWQHLLTKRSLLLHSCSQQLSIIWLLTLQVIDVSVFMGQRLKSAVAEMKQHCAC